MRRLSSWRFAALACTIIAVPPSAYAVEKSFDVAPYLRPQRLVDIGSRRLNLYCSGNGSPTVILDAGLGGTTADWRYVQPAVARITRVCSYDRAGMGFSDPAPLPRNAATIVADLHALLMRARIAAPYVLVGHSIAGYYDRLFADLYRSQVAGMVLVDPSIPDQSHTIAKISPAVGKLMDAFAATAKMCAAAARDGRLAQSPKIQAECGVPTVSNVRKACAKESAAQCKLDVLQARLPSTGFWEDETSEMLQADVSSKQTAQAQRPYVNMPLVVLTSTTLWESLPAPRAQKTALQEHWKAMHDRIAALSSRGVNFPVAGSGHYIQLDRPSVVVSAINEVVQQSRNASGTP